MDYDAAKIREVYHGLWRTEESFRIMKSDFDAGPIYLNKRGHIRAHFLICFVSLVILRLIQNGMRKEHLSAERIAETLRGANEDQVALDYQQIQKTFGTNFYYTYAKQEDFKRFFQEMRLGKKAEHKETPCKCFIFKLCREFLLYNCKSQVKTYIKEKSDLKFIPDTETKFYHW